MKNFLILFSLFVVLIGCSSIQTKYDAVKEIDTIRSYEKFLQENPNSKFDKEIRERIEELNEIKLQQELKAKKRREKEEALRRAEEEKERKIMSSLTVYPNGARNMKNLNQLKKGMKISHVEYLLGKHSSQFKMMYEYGKYTTYNSYIGPDSRELTLIFKDDLLEQWGYAK